MGGEDRGAQFPIHEIGTAGKDGRKPSFNCRRRCSGGRIRQFDAAAEADRLPQDGRTSVDADNVIMRISDFLRPMERLPPDPRGNGRICAARTIDGLGGILNQISSVQNDVKRFVELAEDGYVYWVEAHFQFRGRSVWMYAVPIDVSKLLREGMFDRKSSVVMTSATLTVNKSFQYVKELLGWMIRRKASGCAPRKCRPRFATANKRCCLSRATFPAFAARMGKMHSQGADRFSRRFGAHRRRTHARAVYVLPNAEGGIRSASRGARAGRHPGARTRRRGLSRSRLTKQFMDHPASVLLGTSSFWEGVDLPGDSLTCLAIVRLPFQPPNHPVIEAKSEKLESENKNPFMKLSLPQAVIRFKQGFGRLVRTTSGPRHRHCIRYARDRYEIRPDIF